MAHRCAEDGVSLLLVLELIPGVPSLCCSLNHLRTQPESWAEQAQVGSSLSISCSMAGLSSLVENQICSKVS